MLKSFLEARQTIEGIDGYCASATLSLEARKAQLMSRPIKFCFFTNQSDHYVSSRRV